VATRNAVESHRNVLVTWRRDYRLSLALLLAGVFMLVALSAFSYWADLTGSYPTSFGAGLAIYLIGTAGGMLILLAGTVAWYHRSGLKQLARGR
jgi:hypothetical protein